MHDASPPGPPAAIVREEVHRSPRHGHTWTSHFPEEDWDDNPITPITAEIDPTACPATRTGCLSRPRPSVRDWYGDPTAAGRPLLDQ